MESTLSILPDGGRTRVFLCPACRQTIALGCERCRFCSAVIDQQAAIAAAKLMDRVNLACNEAAEIRMRLTWERAEADSPIGIRESYLVPFLLARWWIRFGALRIEDAEFIETRKDMALYTWLVALLLVCVLGTLAVGIFHK